MPNPQFNVTQFNAMIAAKGLTFRWSRAAQCPCATSDTRGVDPTCALCLGRGVWYVHPRAATLTHQVDSGVDWAPLKAVLSSQTVEEDRTPAVSLWRSGRADLTVPLGEVVGFRDRFVAVQHQMPWTEIVRRDTSSAVVPVGRTGRPTATQLTALRYRPLSILFVGGADGTLYRENSDYLLRRPQLDEPGVLQWVTGRGPSNGSYYTVVYLCHPTWVVADYSFAAQASIGPAAGLKGTDGVQQLPTTYHVALDFLANEDGSGA